MMNGDFPSARYILFLFNSTQMKREVRSESEVSRSRPRLKIIFIIFHKMKKIDTNLFLITIGTWLG